MKSHIHTRSHIFSLILHISVFSAMSERERHSSIVLSELEPVGMHFYSYHSLILFQNHTSLFRIFCHTTMPCIHMHSYPPILCQGHWYRPFQCHNHISHAYIPKSWWARPGIHPMQLPMPLRREETFSRISPDSSILA